MDQKSIDSSYQTCRSSIDSGIIGLFTSIIDHLGLVTLLDIHHLLRLISYKSRYLKHNKRLEVILLVTEMNFSLINRIEAKYKNAHLIGTYGDFFGVPTNGTKLS